MANRKITDLPNSAALSGSESFILDQASLVDITGFNTVRTSLDDIRSYVTTGTPGLDIDGNVTIDGTVNLKGSLSASDNLEVQNLSAFNSLYVGEGGIDVTGGIDIALGDLDVQAGNQIISGGFDLFDIFGSGGAGAGTLLQVTLNGNETTEDACFGGTLSAQNFLASTDCNQNKPFETTNSILGGLDHCNYSEFTTIIGGLSNVSTLGESHILGGSYNRNAGCHQCNSTIFGTRNRIGANEGSDTDAESAGCNNTIAGGFLNRISQGTCLQSNNFIGAGSCNNICNKVDAGCFEGGASVSCGDDNAIVAGCNNSLFKTERTFIGSGADHRTCLVRESFIGGGRGNELCFCTNRSAIVAGNSNLLCQTQGSFIGSGSENNLFGVCYGVLGGGRMNNVQPTGDHGAIVGGICNTVAAPAGLIGGGESNVVVGSHAAIAGGKYNCAQGDYTFVGGGQCSTTNSSNYQFIGSGFKNISCASYASVINGDRNVNTSQYSTVIAGSANAVLASEYSVIAGKGNKIKTGSSYSSILNGLNNCADPSSIYATILGGRNNIVGGGDFSLVWGDNNNNQNPGSYNVMFGCGNTIQAGANTSDVNLIHSYGSSICCGSDFNAIIGGVSTHVQPNVCCAIVLGMGSNFRATANSTTYVCNLSVQGTPNFSTGFSGNIAGCSTITVTNGIITAAS